LDLPLQQQMETNQNIDAAMLKATAIHSNASIFVPTELLMSYSFKPPSSPPTSVEKVIVEVRAATTVKNVAA
jgi:hypothetical protein